MAQRPCRRREVRTVERKVDNGLSKIAGVLNKIAAMPPPAAHVMLVVSAASPMSGGDPAGYSVTMAGVRGHWGSYREHAEGAGAHPCEYRMTRGSGAARPCTHGRFDAPTTAPNPKHAHKN